MNKKGFIFGTLIKVILLIAVFGILIYVTTKYWAPLVGNAADRYICKISVILNTKTKVMGAESKFALKCPMEEINVKTKDKEKIKRQLALSMYDCWWKLGEGKLDFVSDWVFFEDKPECVLCSRINFNKNAYQGSISVKEFQDYLNTKNVPGQKKTYAEYFVGLDNSNLDFSQIEEFKDKQPEIIINSDDPQYVVFLAYKPKGTVLEQLKTGGKTTLMFAGTALGVGYISKKIPGIGLISGAIGGIITRITVAHPLGGLITVGTIGVIGTTIGAVGRAEEFYPAILIIPGEDVAKYCRTLA